METAYSGQYQTINFNMRMHTCSSGRSLNDLLQHLWEENDRAKWKNFQWASKAIVPSQYLGHPCRRFCYCYILPSSCVFLYRPPSSRERGEFCWECYMLIASRKKLRTPFDVNISVHHFETVYNTRYHYNSIVCVDTGNLCSSPPSLSVKVMHVDEIIQWNIVKHIDKSILFQ